MKTETDWEQFFKENPNVARDSFHSYKPEPQTSELEDWTDGDDVHLVQENVANKDLKKFLMAPDRQAIREIATATRNPNLLQQVADEDAERECRAFVAAEPRYSACDGNFNVLSNYLQDRGEAMTKATLQAAFHVLFDKGDLEVKPGTAKPLNEQQLAFISQQSQRGDTEGAVLNFIRWSLGETAMDEFQEAEDAWDIASNPALRPVFEKATWFVFENSQLDYSPSPERRQAMQKYCANRYPTMVLLRAAWAAVREQEKKATKSALFDPVPEAQPSQEKISNMSDEEIARLFNQTRVHLARKS